MTPPDSTPPFSVPSQGPPDESAGTGRAAMLMMIAGALELIAFGMLALFCLSIEVTPLEELQAKMQLPPAQMEQMANVKEGAIAATITSILLGVVPGLTYLALSFGVRAGRYIATQIALLLIATQMIVFGMMFLAVAIEAISQVNPVMLTFNVITLGSLLMLLAFSFKYLLQARIGAKLALRSDREPWDSPDE